MLIKILLGKKNRGQFKYITVACSHFSLGVWDCLLSLLAGLSGYALGLDWDLPLGFMPYQSIILRHPSTNVFIGCILPYDERNKSFM